METANLRLSNYEHELNVLKMELNRMSSSSFGAFELAAKSLETIDLRSSRM